MTAGEPARSTPIKPRDDVLVSVCFGDLSSDTCTFDAISKLALEIGARFRFYEIIVLVEETRKATYLPLIHQVNNLRLFTVRDGTAFYRKRVIAAEEAIGDVLLLTSATELAGINAIEMITHAVDKQSAVLATRGSKGGHRSVGALLVLLGRMAGFTVNLHDLQTLALPRTLLNQLLAHPDPDLALRFPPRDVQVPLALMPVAPGVSMQREAGLHRRLQLLQKLLVYLAPSLLMMVTLTAALLSVLGFAFGLYILGVWIFRDNLAPGWLTLSGALSLTAFFMGVSITGLSLGLQQLLSRTHRESLDGIATEVNRIDLYGQVATELNVDLDRSQTDSV